MPIPNASATFPDRSVTRVGAWFGSATAGAAATVDRMAPTTAAAVTVTARRRLVGDLMGRLPHRHAAGPVTEDRDHHRPGHRGPPHRRRGPAPDTAGYARTTPDADRAAA